MSDKSKEEIQALKKVKADRVQGALKNSLLALRKLGITSADAFVDGKTGDGYLVFKLGDLVKLFERKARSAAKKANKNMTVKCHVEYDIKKVEEEGEVRCVVDTDNSVVIIYIGK